MEHRAYDWCKELQEADSKKVKVRFFTDDVPLFVEAWGREYIQVPPSNEDFFIERSKKLVLKERSLVRNTVFIYKTDQDSLILQSLEVNFVKHIDLKSDSILTIRKTILPESEELYILGVKPSEWLIFKNRVIVDSLSYTAREEGWELCGTAATFEWERDFPRSKDKILKKHEAELKVEEWNR